MSDITQKLKEYALKYTDPEDPEQFTSIVEEMKNCPTIQDLLDLIKKVYPDWIITQLNRYCPNYPHLQKNWETLCEKIGCCPQVIIIVEEFERSNKHKLIQYFAEALTRAGFVIRKSMEIVPCSNCFNYALPSPMLYQTMKSKGIPVPIMYSKVCKYCS